MYAANAALDPAVPVDDCRKVPHYTSSCIRTQNPTHSPRRCHLVKQNLVQPLRWGTPCEQPGATTSLTAPSPAMQPSVKHESWELFMKDPNSPRMAGNLRVCPLGVV